MTTAVSPPRGFGVPGDPFVVLDDAAGVDDQHEVLGAEPVDQDVVDERALRRGQRGILRLPNRQSRRVVGRQPLDGREGVGAGQLDLAHVTDIEEPGAGADGQVLIGDARVLDGHFPAAELDHARAARHDAGR